MSSSVSSALSLAANEEYVNEQNPTHDQSAADFADSGSGDELNNSSDQPSDNKRRRYDDEDEENRRTRTDRVSAEQDAAESAKTHKGETNTSSSSTSGSTQDNSFECRVLCDPVYIGALIGKGGSNINRMRELTKCYCNMLKSVNEQVKERVTLIKGSEEGVGRCLSLIAQTQIETDHARANRSSSSAGNDEQKIPVSDTDTTELKILVQKHLLGPVIGKGGETIKLTQAETGVKLHISKECMGNSTEKLMQVSGTLSQIEQAIQRVLSQLKSANRSSYNTIQYIPTGPLGQGSMSGYGQQQNYNRSMQFEPNRHIPHFDPNTMQQLIEQKLAIPSVCAGCVIGKQGQTIANLRQKSNCSIVVEKEQQSAPGERYIIIRGTSVNIQTAIALIRQCVESYKPPPTDV